MTGTRIFVALSLGLALASTGCKNAKARCEHARDVIAKSQDTSAQRALATIEDLNARAELERRSKGETERFKAHFVEQCVAAPEATHACVARLEEFLADHAERMAAFDRCSSASLEQRAACLNEATKPTATEIAECREPLAALMSATYAAAETK